MLRIAKAGATFFLTCFHTFECVECDSKLGRPKVSCAAQLGL